MRTSATNRKLRVLLTGIQNGNLVPRPEFQRRLVWSTKHKLAFLKTVLEGYPFPEIYIAAGEVNSETGEGKELLVDGQQRITTLFQYFKGSDEFKLHKEIPPYHNLSEADKIRFLEYEVVVRDLGKLELVEILEIFQRINSTNYALNAMEIHNARFEGEFKEFGEELARHSFFEQNHFFTTPEIRRMGDTKFCLTLAATFIGGYFNRDDALEQYLEAYNAEFSLSDELSEQFNNISDVITRCNFDAKDRIWKKADLFSILVELHRAIYKRKIEIQPAKISKKLKSFFAEVDNSDVSGSLPNIYYKSALQATNDRGSRIKRGEILQSVIDETYTPNIGIEDNSSVPKNKPVTKGGKFIFKEMNKHPIESEKGVIEFLSSITKGKVLFSSKLRSNGVFHELEDEEFRLGIDELLKLGWLYAPEKILHTLHYEFKDE